MPATAHPPLPASSAALPDLASILAVDWLLDRLRTAVNLLGDAFGCVLVDHRLRRRPRGAGLDPSGSGAGDGGGKAIPYIQLGEAPPR